MGVQPVGTVQHIFAWWYVYGAVEPTTGDRFCLERPYLKAELCQLFVDTFARACPDSLHILLRDHSGAPTSPRLTRPAHVRLRCLPPYGPELNPIERVWRDLKDDVAWQPFANLEAQQAHLSTLLRAYEPATLPSLAGYPDLVEAIHALGA
ncbi:MAG TPA: transposase [Candidatus Tectomicrobia bacterium]